MFILKRDDLWKIFSSAPFKICLVCQANTRSHCQEQPSRRSQLAHAITSSAAPSQKWTISCLIVQHVLQSEKPRNEKCPMWNQRPSASAGPLPKKTIYDTATEKKNPAKCHRRTDQQAERQSERIRWRIRKRKEENIKVESTNRLTDGPTRRWTEDVTSGVA